MSQLDQTLLIFFIVYVLAVIGISLYRTNQAQELADHVLAGRRVGTIATGLSASSSLERGWALFILPAIAFGSRSLVVGMALAILIGLWATWMVVAPRLHRFTIETQNSLTIPEYLERRFADRTGILRALGAALTLLFVLFYVSAGVTAGGILFNIAFDLSVAVGGLITLLVVLAYIFIGGYVVVARTDVFQSIVTLVGVAVLAVAVYVVTDNAAEGIADSFVDDFGSGRERVGVFLFSLFLIATVQGAFGAQRLLQRFMAAKSESIMASSRRISTVWILLIFGCSVLLGLFAENAMPDGGLRLAVSSGTAGERGILFFYWLAELIASPILGAIALTAVIAAIMSTVDSQMLIGASVATSDLPIVRRAAQRRRFVFVLGAYMRVWVGRLMLIVIGIAAWLLAQSQPNSIITFLTYAWLGTGGTFGPVVLLSLYWRRFNAYGAMAALVAGGLITLVCAAMDVTFMVFGAITLSVLPIAVIATLATKAPSAEVEALFDRCVAKPETE